MWNEYAETKARELDAELARSRHHHQIPPPAERVRKLAPLARAAGRRARRIGEALESWATPCPEVAPRVDG